MSRLKDYILSASLCAFGIDSTFQWVTQPSVSTFIAVAIAWVLLIATGCVKAVE